MVSLLDLSGETVWTQTPLVWGQMLSFVVVLFCYLGKLTLTVPLSDQVYNWVLAKL